MESPSNPFLRLYDIKRLRDALPGARIIYDTTFQGLVNGQALYPCADYVVMSCTKYIGGHNDVLGGLVACMNENLFAPLWNDRSMRGGIIDNFTAYLLLRSLRTYDIRMEKSLANVEQVLEFLEAESRITEIFYPGRYSNSAQRALFNESFSHGGSVVTFRVDREVDVASSMRKLFSTKMAPSFGSVDSLIEIPMYMSHWGKSEAEVAKLGLDPQTVRLSVGNEPVEFILNDLKRLLLM